MSHIYFTELWLAKVRIFLEYEGYEEYSIQKGSRNFKAAKLRQRKTTTQLEHQKLVTVRENIDHLNDFINYSEQITALKASNMIIIYQISTEQHRFKETLFGRYQDNKDKGNWKNY